MSTETMALTLENVEKVLDELRPFLMADGGNVEVVELDGPIVKVRLQGACGSCPSSTMTLKMGIERKMRESIPEVSEVVQVLERAPSMDRLFVYGSLKADGSAHHLLDGALPKPTAPWIRSN